MDTTSSKPVEPQILSCWKDIANFFGKGIRTVQRWEALGLPVYRPDKEKSIVFADPEELRRWALRNVGMVTDLEKSLARKLTPAQRRLLSVAEDIMKAEKSAKEEGVDSALAP